MKTKRQQALALRMLRRDWRSGELRILAAALVIAVAAVTSINLLTDRFGRLLTRESAELVGGDLVVRSTRTPDRKWLQAGQKLGLETAEIIEFSTVIVFGDELLLSSIKAVSNSYPLRGSLRVADQPYGDERKIRQAPEAGTVWADARVLTRLDVKVGDVITLGSTQLQVAGVLAYEPDRGGNLFNLAPRVMMNLADIEAAQVIKPGSRVTWKYLFAGSDSDKRIAVLREQLEPDMGSGHRLVDIKSGRGRTGDAMGRAEQYLGLTALLAIFLAAIAIAMAARRYSERHYDVSGMLRCLGVQQRQLTRLYLWQLVLLAIFAAAVGTVLGWAAHMALLAAISGLLSQQLPAAGVAPWATGFGAALLLILGMALPPVLRLKSVPPLRVFRRELTPLPVSAWLVYGVALASICGLVLLLFDNVGIVLAILLMAGLVLAVMGGVLYSLLKTLRKVMPFRGRLLTRSLRNLAGHAGTSAGQILSFGLTAMLMVILLLLRSDLLDEWREQLPENVPNNFAFNIQPYERDAFAGRLGQMGIDAALYPIVRGRLATINGQEPGRFDGNDGVGRELNFTWASALPADNEVVAGNWPPEQKEQAEVSVEAELAARLDIEVGDQLNFNIAGSELRATVSSLRTVKWESFSPNFYMIFSPGALADFPVFYLTSFRLEQAEKPQLSQLISEFPSVTIVEVDAIIEQLQSIIQQVTLMIEMMLVFVLLAGVTVFLASIQSTLDERVREGALMRAVGASRRYLRAAALSEFALLGLLAGLLAVVGAEAACSALYERIFDMQYQYNWWLWLALPLVLAAGVGWAGYLSTRKVVEVSPRQLLGA